MPLEQPFDLSFPVCHTLYIHTQVDLLNPFPQLFSITRQNYLSKPTPTTPKWVLLALFRMTSFLAWEQQCPISNSLPPEPTEPNRKKEVETGTSSVSASLLLFQTRCRFDYAVLKASFITSSTPALSALMAEGKWILSLPSFFDEASTSPCPFSEKCSYSLSHTSISHFHTGTTGIRSSVLSSS